MAEPTPQHDQTALRIAAALTAAAYECDGNCGLSDRDCYDAHPINFSARVNGTTHIDAPVTAIAAVVMAVLPEHTDRAAVLREAADRYATLVDQNEAYELAEHGQIDHETRIQFEAVRDVVTGLRRMADEAQPGHDDEHRCQPCTDRHGAPGWTDDTQPAAKAQQDRAER
ncbi:hypothetical protein [Streptomyces longwoodensis]|uniref:hypothetical protein n=1 Tax=Streptomyces longwoodensis TaxID=68231 RepID=UPI0022568BAD|nr:hypothetical protein [Streptomyces longwoodensis]MCX5000904.1 hypothetical protein [Streptomyces longwoodensis]